VLFLHGQSKLLVVLCPRRLEYVSFTQTPPETIDSILIK
jgi:hypothetical protein